MTLGEYYKQKREDSTVFQKARSDMMLQVKKRVGAGKTKKEIEDLETFLNKAFYPNDSNNANYQQFINLLLDAFEQVSDKKLREFEMGTQLKLQEDTGNPLTLIRDQHDVCEHKQKIYKETLLNRKKKVEEKLKQIAKNPNIADKNKIEETKQELKKLGQQLKNLLKQEYQIDKKGEFIRVTDDSKELIDNMDKLYSVLSIGTITPKDYGDILELALGLLSDEMTTKLGDNSIKELVKEMFDKSQKNSGPILGAQHVSGDSILNIETFIDTSELDKFVTSKSKLKHTLKLKDIEITSRSDSSRQGKIDVNLILNDKKISSTPFRVSAKNWQSGSGDFGETELWYALSRTLNNTVAERLFYNLGDKDSESSGSLAEAHKLIHLSIVLDGLMGYSQKNNWVDTLVINRRDGSGVKVEYIPDLIEEFNNSESTKIYTNYKEQNTRKHALSIMEKNLKNITEKRSTLYKMYMIQHFIGTKVAAKYRKTN